ncbi:trypsin-like serine protease [Siminovitchia sp. FSL H7-0308]|uniref:trypsin-like serine peptidase n=1 Tax=Siminovitchia sp. FSL H7-0308 TaxID=2921432 RepID=UPI0030EB468B
MKKSLYLVLCMLLFAYFVGPMESLAASPQQESPNEIYERFDLPKLDKDKTLALEERYKKDIQKLPKQKDIDAAELKQLESSNLKTTSVSSQGNILEEPNAPKLNSPVESTSPDVTSLDVSPLSADNRVKVTNTTISPYNAMAQITFRDSSGSWYVCSGSFINETTVLTAAHCVYDSYNDEFFSYWAVSPGQNGTELPYDGVASTTAYAPLGWMSSNPPDPSSVYFKDVQYDYAVIKIDSTHSPKLSLRKNAGVNDPIISHGYPADKGTGTGYYYLYKSSGKINNISQNTIIHSSSVTGGMSGGPILNSNSVISVNSTASWGPKFGPSEIYQIYQWMSL